MLLEMSQWERILDEDEHDSSINIPEDSKGFVPIVRRTESLGWSNNKIVICKDDSIERILSALPEDNQS